DLPSLERPVGCRVVRAPPSDAKKNATSRWLECLEDYRRKLHQQTTSAALFAQPPVLDFADPPLEPASGARAWQVLKTRRREVVTLSIGPFIAHETIWRHPTTAQRAGSAQLRRWVAPGCTYGYDVVEEVGRKLFVEAQSVRQVIQLL